MSGVKLCVLRVDKPNINKFIGDVIEALPIAVFEGSEVTKVRDNYVRVVITDIELVMKTIVILQNMGIKVSIDDFGTGYSSLAYLRKLPIDKIKIDRSFIQEVATNDSDLTIVKTMVELSHGLGKRVLAEGVETQQQLQLLRNIGCDAVQGYFISKPISEEEFTKYLKRK